MVRTTALAQDVFLAHVQGLRQQNVVQLNIQQVVGAFAAKGVNKPMGGHHPFDAFALVNQIILSAIAVKPAPRGVDQRAAKAVKVAADKIVAVGRQIFTHKIQLRQPERWRYFKRQMGVEDTHLLAMYRQVDKMELFAHALARQTCRQRRCGRAAVLYPRVAVQRVFGQDNQLGFHVFFQGVELTAGHHVGQGTFQQGQGVERHLLQAHHVGLQPAHKIRQPGQVPVAAVNIPADDFHGFRNRLFGWIFYCFLARRQGVSVIISHPALAFGAKRWIMTAVFMTNPHM